MSLTLSQSDLLASPATDPLMLYQIRDGLQTPDLLAAAIVDLDLFTWMKDRTPTLAEMCAGLSIQERPADVMVTLFCAMGLLERKGERLALTATSREHLVQGSPWFIGPYYGSMKDRPVTRDYVQVLRTGKPAGWASIKDHKAWAQAMEEDGFARQFTAAMDCRGVLLGNALAKAVSLQNATRVLDVAGGSGIYACALVARWPGLQAVVMEKPPIYQLARRFIQERGFADCVEAVQGDLFGDSWPVGCDVHLISNVLHDWDVPAVRIILERSYAALPKGGRLLVHDVHINREKTGSLHAAQYSALLMHITEGKCYSVGEMESLLTNAGFREIALIETTVGRSVMTATKP